MPFGSGVRVRVIRFSFWLVSVYVPVIHILSVVIAVAVFFYVCVMHLVANQLRH